MNNSTVKPHKYSVKLTYQSTRTGSPWPKIEGKILEGDMWVGNFTRGAKTTSFGPAIRYRFFSQGALARFDDFANCLSISESIEALLPKGTNG